MRLLQKALAEDITTRVHSKEDYETAVKASNILFGKSTAEDLLSLSERDFLAVFDGVPRATISQAELNGEGANIIGLLAEKTGFLKSNGEARRELKGNAISVNKEKVNESFNATTSDLISDKYLLLQKGKKNYFIVIVE